MSARRETIAYFRDEFEKTRHVTDPDQIGSLLKHGRILLKQTEASMMLGGIGGNYSPLRGARAG